MNHDEINDMTKESAVNQIADCPAENQGKADLRQPSLFWSLAPEPKHEQDDCDSDCNQHPVIDKSEK